MENIREDINAKENRRSVACVSPYPADNVDPLTVALV